MTRWSAITRTPPQLLRARLRLALHSRGGEDLNRLVHHERGRYFKHFGMDLEFLLRCTPRWRLALEQILFTDGDIVEADERAEEAEDDG